MSKYRLIVFAGSVALLSAAPASAATTSCGTVKGVGNGTSVTKVTKTSGSCTTAKTVAKGFARTRVAPKGYACKERFTAMTKATVACRRPGRTITFRVSWAGTMPLPPAAAPPSANAGG